MCGRYAAFREAQDLAREFDVEVVEAAAAEHEASWNVAPTDGVRVVLDRAPKPDRGDVGVDGGTGAVTREMHLARWALVPSWAKALRGGGAPMFNARIETVATKPAFRTSLAARRCVVPADGYYEWRTDPAPDGGKPVKTPFFIHRAAAADGTTPSLAFAGLYSWWRDPAREEDDPERWVLSTTVLTQPARDGLEAIHDREPVVLPADAVAAWLDPTCTGADDALEVLAAAPPELRWYEVGTRVGSVRHNDARLLEAV
ncbi:SOS response-associated peptidase [Serinibacter arcticus]|uniref:Abasic site processing protein n=1 Tax=Serinibacter arcticus TaxID=1655435 RepID=A0A4Z1E2B0_9MICO|nr:SOS response-associated peptidase [Serinibacter arcticus]TGO06135.1 protein of unknown function DUF159 [Serinibacter arcticus]